jgi:hypothetical protein
LRVVVTAQTAGIFEELDPKAPVIKYARQGERFPLVHEGTGWYRIKVQEKEGWLEKRKGKILDDSRTHAVMTMRGALVVVGCLIIVTALMALFQIFRRNMHS